VDPISSVHLIAQSPAKTNQVNFNGNITSFFLNFYTHDSVITQQHQTARKSQNWNKLVCISSSIISSQSTVGVKKEEKGKIIILQNQTFQDVPFELHQCDPSCVDKFQCTEAHFNSKSAVLNFALLIFFSGIRVVSSSGQRNILLLALNNSNCPIFTYACYLFNDICSLY